MSLKDPYENSLQFSDDDTSNGGCSSSNRRSVDLDSLRPHRDHGSGAGSKRHYSLAESLCEEGDESECGETKRKTRNLSEKKRRDQFNMLIHELLSMVSYSNRKMDKTTVLKTAITFLKKHNEMAAQSHAHEVQETWKPSFLTNDEFMQIMLDASNAFVLVITKVGNILYASENVTSAMGYKANDLINHSIFDYIYKDDIPVLYHQLGQHQLVAGDDNIEDYQQEKNQMNLFFRMRQDTFPPVYHLLSCQGCFRFWSKKDAVNTVTGLPLKPTTCYCCIVRRSNPPCMYELSYLDENKNEFTSRQSTEWKFLFLDHRGPMLIGYQPFELLGNSMYDFIHPDDLEMLANSHKELSETGKSQSCYYRFLTKGEQWLWLKSSYYISYNQWNSKPEFIVCTNTVVSLSVAQAALKEKSQRQPNQLPRQVTESVRCSSTVSIGKNADAESGTIGQAEETTGAIPSNSFVYLKTDEKEASPCPSDLVTGTSPNLPVQESFSRQNSCVEPGPSRLSVVSSSVTTNTATEAQAPKSLSRLPATVIKSVLEGCQSSSQKMPTSGRVSVRGAPSLANQVLSVRQIHLTKAQQLLFHQLKAKHHNLLDTLRKQQEELQGVVDMLNLSQDAFLLPVDGTGQASSNNIQRMRIQDQQQFALQQQVERVEQVMQQQDQHFLQQQEQQTVMGQQGQTTFQGHQSVQQQVSQRHQVMQGQVSQEQKVILRQVSQGHQEEQASQGQQVIQQQGQQVMQQQLSPGKQVSPGHQVTQQQVSQGHQLASPEQQQVMQQQGQQLSPGESLMQQRLSPPGEQVVQVDQHGQQTLQVLSRQVEQSGQHMVQCQPMIQEQTHPQVTQTLSQVIQQQTLPGQQVVQQQTLPGQQVVQQQNFQEQLSHQQVQIMPQSVTMVPVNIISPVMQQNSDSQLIQIIQQQPRQNPPQNPLHFGQGSNLRLRNLLQQPPR